MFRLMLLAVVPDAVVVSRVNLDAASTRPFEKHAKLKEARLSRCRQGRMRR